MVSQPAERLHGAKLVDTWPLPAPLRKLLDSYLSDAINLRTGEYLMQQGRITYEQAMRDLVRRVAKLEEASSEVRSQLNALGELRMQQKQTTCRERSAARRAKQRARRGWS